MRYFCRIFKTMLLCAAFNVNTEIIQAQPAARPKTASAIRRQDNNCSYKIIGAAGKTFGYDIFQNNRLIIHQPAVPAMPGNGGFKTRAGAGKVAQLVIQKNTGRRNAANCNYPGNEINKGIIATPVNFSGIKTFVHKQQKNMKSLLIFLLLTAVYSDSSGQCTPPVITASGPTTLCTGGTVTLSAPASNVWTQKADLGGMARSGAVGFSIGNRGYIGTGLGAGYYNDFWEYDPGSDVWTQKGPIFPVGQEPMPPVFSIGSKGYIGTGSAGGGYYEKDFWEYDPAGNTWTQKADFGGAERYSATGFFHRQQGIYRYGAISAAVAIPGTFGNTILLLTPGHRKPVLAAQQDTLPQVFSSAAKDILVQAMTATATPKTSGNTILLLTPGHRKPVLAARQDLMP